MTAKSLFIKLIQHHGFNIKGTLVDQLRQKGSEIDEKGRKPAIGFHWHCCVNQETKDVVAAVPSEDINVR